MRKLFAIFRYFFIFFLFTGSCELLNAQFEVEGTVTTTQGQSLPGADVWLKSTEFQNGCVTDSTGHFSINVPGGKYLIIFRYLGYTTYTDSLSISHNIKLNVTLFEEAIKGKEVTILGKQPDNNIKSAETGVTKLEQRDIKKLPRIIGETDAIKALQYTPGVTLTGEGNSGIYVRGGAADQNLILIDDAVVYNPAHLLGIFSVFNTDILHQVELYKGGIPAGFGGRISSVIDIQTKDGNFEKMEGNASVGFISSKAYVSGPVIKEKVSAFVSARKCYLNALLGPVSKILFNNASNLVFNGLGYNFFDINAGVNARLSKKSKIQFRIYNGGDYLNLNRSDLNLQNDLKWTNLASSLQYLYFINTKSTINFTTSYSQYKFAFKTIQNLSFYKLTSTISDISNRLEYSHYWLKHTVHAGLQMQFLDALPNSSNAHVELIDLTYEYRNKYHTQNLAVYFNDEFEAGSKIKINLGYRHTFYRLTGSYKDYTYDENGNPVDSVIYKPGQTVVWYQHPDIRVAARYLINEKTSVKASFGTLSQYLNQVTVSAVSLPSDFWIPSTRRISPQFSAQLSAGIFRNFKENKFETSFEIFYKWMDNQIEFNNSIFNTRLTQSIEDNLVFGKGKAYGAEYFVRKTKGRLTGWLSYTYSRSFRYFDEINHGNRFPAKYDRIHDGSLVISYELSPRVTLSGVFVYATGEAFTLPVARYIIQGNILNVYGDYNGYRLPDYHRLDLSVTWLLKESKKWKSELNFSVYNVYNRQNPIYLYYEPRGNIDNYDLRITPQQISLLPVLPSVNYTFSF